MKKIIFEKIKDAVKKAGYEMPADFAILTPPKMEMGDYATNVAMILAKKGENPNEIAKKIIEHLEKEKVFSRVEIAGAGFINIFFDSKIFQTELKKILSEKEEYGRGEKKSARVNVEFISANPTGPLHIGNARGGPIGEAIARIYEFLGYKVEREFYVNDMGLQIDRFGQSLYYWYYKKIDERAEFPEDGYPGDYIKEISEKIQKEKVKELREIKEKEDFVQFFIKEGLYHTVKSMREDAKLLGIEFDTWSRESDLIFSDKTKETIDILEQKGFTTKKEGAVWFKNPEDKDLEDKESVLIKSDGKSFTYFSDDIAYHMNKLERGSDILINIWGANHHGHLPRFRAAMRAMGVLDDKIIIIFYQYIRLKEAGEVVSMGKRLGNFVTLRQVIEAGVAPDAFKYFILSQNPNTPFDFDLKLATDTTEKNPVFYIKYAYARISSILAKVEEGSESGWDFQNLKDKKEVVLYRELIKFPQLLNDTMHDFQIQALPHYAHKIAGLFHDFYTSCPVLDSDPKTKKARLALILATKIILKNSLSICAIETPEKM